MSEQHPDHRPPAPKILKGIANVSGQGDTVFTIDFNTCECDCQHGAAWRWDNRRWVPNSYCNHKLKALASLVEQTGDEELQNFYEHQIGKRHNAFVAVSSMHKELRRGDQEKALYWAMVMLPHRGRHGVVGYMRNILFEETRDLQLGKMILRLSEEGKSVSLLDMQRLVRRFCVAQKKWELPERHGIFMDEMRGYRKLAKDYGYEVAKGKDIIDPKASAKLKGILQEGFTDGDRVKVQIGLKGWFKSKSRDHDTMKIEMFNFLVDILNGERPNSFDHDEDYCNRLQAFLLRRIKNHGSPGYHELNVLCDALTGEAEPTGVSTLQHKRIVNSPRLYRLPLGDLRQSPLYAHDNHTWKGKSLMKAYGAAQLQPSAVQDKLDFRLCGAYMGVAWRTLAYKQFKSIDVPWGKVSWRNPNWLWQHLDNMWY